MSDVKHMKWWGWGVDGVGFHYEDKPGFAPFVLQAVGLDLLTGILCAFHQKIDKTQGGGFLSRSFFLGLTRKLMMLALVMLATALDTMLGSDGVARLAVIGFYAANEGLSILENAALLGLPLPGALTEALERVKDVGKVNA